MIWAIGRPKYHAFTQHFIDNLNITKADRSLVGDFSFPFMFNTVNIKSWMGRFVVDPKSVGLFIPRYDKMFAGYLGAF